MTPQGQPHRKQSKACVIRQVEATLVTMGSSKLWVQANCLGSRPGHDLADGRPPRRSCSQGDDEYRAKVLSGYDNPAKDRRDRLDFRRNLRADIFDHSPGRCVTTQRLFPRKPRRKEEHSPGFAAIGLIASRCEQGVKRSLAFRGPARERYDQLHTGSHHALLGFLS